MDIPARETLSVEFKSDCKTIGNKVIVEECVALANTGGGILYIGVEDDGTVTGAQPVHRDPIRLEALVASNTVPPIPVRVDILEENGIAVACVMVPRSPGVVATASGKISRRRLKANGEPETVPMYPYEIPTRLSALGSLDLTAQIVEGTSRADFDPLEEERLRQVIGRYKNSDQGLLELDDSELERALGLTRNGPDGDIPTLTGMLLLGRPESLERFVPSYGASFQVLQGTDVRVNQDFRKPLLYTVEKMREAFEVWNPSAEVSLGLFVMAVPAFDSDAFREALVNAFGHRDYSKLGRVRVEINDEGMIVSNPGGFVEGVSLSNLLNAEPRGRNPMLMDVLKRVGLAERTGRGIDRIYKGSLQYGRPVPDYSATTSEEVTLFLARCAPDTAFIAMLDEERAKTGRPLSIQALLVLDALKREPRATIVHLKQRVESTEQGLQVTLGQLVEAGLVEAVGTGASRSYMLSARVYAAHGKASEYVRQTDIENVRYPELVMKLARTKGSITTADVKDLLRVDYDRAYYTVSKLVREKSLQKVGSGRASRYVPTPQKS